MLEQRNLLLDPALNKINKVSKLSNYNNDFQNWGKIEKKLVEKRPEEKYYPLHFYGKSSYAINN
jgi:hypothetical protein